MPRNMEIDFVRQAIYQTVLLEYIKNPTKYIGGVNDFMLTSFYEHLTMGDEVDRYTKNVRELTKQQNRTGLIANGVIVAPTSPTITNLNQVTIIPMEFSCAFRTRIETVEKVKDTLDNAVSILKGRKVDIAELDTGDLFMVGTIANNSKDTPLVKNGDYIGDSTEGTINAYITSLKTTLENKGLVFENYTNGSFIVGSYFYFKDTTTNKLSVAVYDYVELANANQWHKVTQTDEYPNIIFPEEHNSFKKWCLSISFDSFRLTEPREINSKNYLDLIFGGSATLVNESVMLGNELTKLGIKRYKVIKSDNGTGDTTFSDNFTWLEPLEMPSGNNAETQMNQLLSNKFVNNSHTNSISLTTQYSFILDRSINLLKELFLYARYGKRTYTSPNMIYNVRELWSCWGNVEKYDFNAKIIESIDIENTESDTLTITLPLQIQGDNN